MTNRGFLTIAIDAVALVALVASGLFVAANWSTLPDVVPIHFGLTGQPDGFGNKIWLAAMPAIGLGMFLMMTLARRYPQMSNLPWKITDANREVQYALIKRLLTWIKLETSLMFAYLVYTMTLVAQGLATGIDSLVMCGFVAAMIATVVTFLVRGYRLR